MYSSNWYISIFNICSLQRNCLLPYLYFIFACLAKSIKELLPLRYLLNWATLNLGDMLTSICMWSGHALTSIISTPFLSHHNNLSILPISAFIYPYIICLLNFGAKTMWYLQIHLLCDKLSMSINRTHLLVLYSLDW